MEHYTRWLWNPGYHVERQWWDFEFATSPDRQLIHSYVSELLPASVGGGKALPTTMYSGLCSVQCVMQSLAIPKGPG